MLHKAHQLQQEAQAAGEILFIRDLETMEQQG
jgi:hypothetical protein